MFTHTESRTVCICTYLHSFSTKTVGCEWHTVAFKCSYGRYGSCLNTSSWSDLGEFLHMFCYYRCDMLTFNLSSSNAFLVFWYTPWMISDVSSKRWNAFVFDTVGLVKRLLSPGRGIHVPAEQASFWPLAVHFQPFSLERLSSRAVFLWHNGCFRQRLLKALIERACWPEKGHAFVDS